MIDVTGQATAALAVGADGRGCAEGATCATASKKTSASLELSSTVVELKVGSCCLVQVALQRSKSTVTTDDPRGRLAPAADCGFSYPKR